jgi:hypothetical protein
MLFLLAKYDLLSEEKSTCTNGIVKSNQFLHV